MRTLARPWTTFSTFPRVSIPIHTLSPLSLSLNSSSLFSPTTPRRLSMASSPRFTAQAVSTGEVRGDDTDVFQIIQSHQGKAARLPPVEEIRTVLDRSVRGVLSTLSQRHDGYPSGSMVDFTCDADGSPILAVSSLAVHSKAQEIPEETGLDIKGEQGNNPTLYGMESSSGKLGAELAESALEIG